MPIILGLVLTITLYAYYTWLSLNLLYMPFILGLVMPIILGLVLTITLHAYHPWLITLHTY